MTLPHDAQPYPGHLGGTEPLLVRCGVGAVGCGAYTLARVLSERYDHGWTHTVCEGMPAAGGALGLELGGCGELLWVDLTCPEAQAWHAHVLEFRAYQTYRRGVTTWPHAPGMWLPSWGPVPSRTPSQPPSAPAIGDLVMPAPQFPAATYLDRLGRSYVATVCPDPRTERGYVLSIGLSMDPVERLEQLGALGVDLSSPAALARWSHEATPENGGKPTVAVRVRAYQGHGRGQFQPLHPLPPGYADPPRHPPAVSGESAPLSLGEE